MTDFYALVHPGGPGGLMTKEPQMQQQDARAQDYEGYVVAFFPKITGLGPATLGWPNCIDSLARSPEAAISKFMDRIKEGETWSTYQDAGHRVRKVRITGLGDPP